MFVSDPSSRRQIASSDRVRRRRVGEAYGFVSQHHVVIISCSESSSQALENAGSLWPAQDIPNMIVAYNTLSCAKHRINSDRCQGRVTLRIPPGTYRTQYLPARGTPYLVTDGKLVVGTKPPAEPVVATLRPAGVIEVAVVDAETGAGIPDVDLWHQTDPNGGREVLYFRSWEVATRIAWVEKPRTDARGKVRALVEPGTHRIGVGFQSYPLSHEVIGSGGQEVECRPGETVQLKFTVRKRR
jgi:hypothetical protein